MTKECIFCGSPVNSKEDVWPVWLVKLLKKNPEEIVPFKSHLLNQPKRQYLTKSGPILAKIVCQSCNNGWMSDLEHRTKPILTPMIRGNAVSLTCEERTIIASWMTKTAMVLDRSHQGTAFYGDGDRIHFKDTQSPSMYDSHVWLGKFSPKMDLRGYNDHRTLRTRFSSGGAIQSHVFTATFGFLALQIVSVKRLVHENRAFLVKLKQIADGGIPLKRLTVKIWPLTSTSEHSVQWPPASSFNDSDQHLQSLADRFGGTQIL